MSICARASKKFAIAEWSSSPFSLFIKEPIICCIKLVTGKEGMGFGDFKMLAMLGAWLGLSAIPLIIIVSSFAGALIGGLLLLFGRSREKPIQYGPFLAIAGWIALMWNDELTSLYLDLAFRSV